MMNAMIEACVEELNKKDRINTPPPVSERKSVVDELLRYFAMIVNTSVINSRT